MALFKSLPIKAYSYEYNADVKYGGEAKYSEYKAASYSAPAYSAGASSARYTARAAAAAAVVYQTSAPVAHEY
jgi:hypothetical protein